MLIEFSVTNFRSIKNEQVLSLLPSGRVRKISKDNRLLTHSNYPQTETLASAVVFGANASGKSNLLRALEALSVMVQEGHDSVLGEGAKAYVPFRLDRMSRELPTNFYIRFIASDGVQYEYELSRDAESVTHEALYSYPKNRRVKLFERSENLPVVFGKKLKGDKQSIARHVLPHQLMLAKGAQLGLGQLMAPWRFFKSHLRAYILYRSVYDDALLQGIAKHIVNDESGRFLKNLSQLVYNADTGIKGIDVVQEDSELMGLFEGRRRFQIKTLHYSEDTEKPVLFELKEESIGTRKLVALGGLILRVLEAGDTLAIDELDQSMHPHLTRALIKLFHNPNTNPKRAQLIFSTHDASLLNDDLFRFDQVFLSERSEDGETEVSSVSDIPNLKKEVPLEEWYLTGKFGGTPAINQLGLEFDFNIQGDEEQKER
ncbi:AAA family ATPase [Flammeovirga agarivorans]|uniref:ATP-binding protein n=1 Tax=Flammeovirga agarivorans TaxID=2726742 RepID=A0A7X8SR82_9BACT|nr:ATP-binding protein [Flammeovirga agarivorans]NLR94809.1 ATP-binding protein [Flammeovirga agarivorans]